MALATQECPPASCPARHRAGSTRSPVPTDPPEDGQHPKSLQPLHRDMVGVWIWSDLEAYSHQVAHLEALPAWGGDGHHILPTLFLPEPLPRPWVGSTASAVAGLGRGKPGVAEAPGLMLHCPTGLQVQNPNSQTELLRTSRQRLQSIRPQRWPLLSVGLVQLLWSHTCDIIPQVTVFNKTEERTKTK